MVEDGTVLVEVTVAVAMAPLALEVVTVVVGMVVVTTTEGLATTVVAVINTEQHSVVVVEARVHVVIDLEFGSPLVHFK